MRRVLGRRAVRLAAVAVSLPCADADFLREWLTDAWEQKAPRRLLDR